MLNRTSRTPLSCTVITLLCGLVSHWASATESLGEVIVQAHPLGDHGNLELARPTAVVDGADVRERRRGGIGQALEGVPGVQTSDFGPGANRPIIRGLGGARVRVLQDGLGSFDASSLSDDHAVAVDTLSAHQIEVLKGPATLLYGSGASGGVVNLVTDRLPLALPDTFHSRLDLRYDSATVGRQVGLHVDAPVGPFALHLEGITNDSNSYRSGAGKVPNSATEADNFAAGIGYIGTRAEAAIGYERYSTDYGIPGEAGFIILHQDRYSARVRAREPLPGVTQVNARLGFGDYGHTEYEEVGIAGTNFDNREYETRIEAELKPLIGWRSVLGVQHQGRDFLADGEEAFIPNPIERKDTGVFWVGERDHGAWHHELGLRGEVSDNRSEGPEPSRDFLVWGGSAGSTWQFDPRFGLSFAYTYAERAPAIEELYANGAHAATSTFEIGSVDLSTEQAHNLDLTLRKFTGRWQFQWSVYANRIQNFIYLDGVDSDADGETDRVNVDEATGLPTLDLAGELLSVQYRQADAWFLGTEAEAGYTLFDDARGLLDVLVRADVVNARLDGGERLPRIAPARIGGGLAWSRGAWEADLDVRRVLRQGETAPGETATDGYTLLDVGVAWDTAIGPLDYRFYVRGANLLDATARRHTSFLKDQAPLPGRALLTGLSVQF